MIHSFYILQNKRVINPGRAVVVKSVVLTIPIVFRLVLPLKLIILCQIPHHKLSVFSTGSIHFFSSFTKIFISFPIFIICLSFCMCSEFLGLAWGLGAHGSVHLHCMHMCAAQERKRGLAGLMEDGAFRAEHVKIDAVKGAQTNLKLYIVG